MATTPAIRALGAMLVAALACWTSAVSAQAPAPKQADYEIANFRFKSGETLPVLRQHYTTLGDPKNDAILVLHGTTGNGGGMLAAPFGTEVFGPGQPLDATKYFVILPDAIGHGKSSKPSDGQKAKFPRYDYDDMVAAQYDLVTKGLGLKHLRLVIGNSMGGMETWAWGETYPDFMDALVPMAAQPTAMSGRNWMLRRLIVDSIRSDPDWKGGEYTEQPRSARFASVFYGLATSGGSIALQNTAPTRAAADKVVDDRLAASFAADANDTLYQWDASRNYDAEPGLDKIHAPLLAVNSADDERNPPETGRMTEAMKRVKGGELFVIPASADTRGHGTTGMAKFWAEKVRSFLTAAPRRGG